MLALEREIKLARDAYLKANQNAQSQEQRDLAHDLFPGQALVDRCVALEAKHRGSRTAIGAMHWIMRMAAMNSDNPATAARARLISVLRDHYLANADVDLLIDEFPHGDTPLEAEQLLRKVAAESPHDYIRATALYELAEVLVAQAYLYDAYKDSSYDKNLAAMIAVQSSERTKDHLRREGENVKLIRGAYRDRGTKVMTTEAERLYEQVATQFADIRRPERRWEGPEDIRLVDDNREAGFRRRTLAELADAKRFQMTNLRIGQPRNPRGYRLLSQAHPVQRLCRQACCLDGDDGHRWRQRNVRSVFAASGPVQGSVGGLSQCRADRWRWRLFRSRHRPENRHQLASYPRRPW